MKNIKITVLLLAAILFSGCMLFQINNSIISTPVDGQYVAGVITILVTPPEDVITDQVTFFIDGTILYLDTTDPWQAEWDTFLETNGIHVIAVELEGLEGEFISNSIEVMVNNQ